MKIDARSKYLGGTQKLVTPEGHIIPSSIREAFTQIDMRPPTDAEMQTFEHAFFISDSPWDPKCIDNEAMYEEYTDGDSNVPALWD
jgi:hypothetical protein